MEPKKDAGTPKISLSNITSFLEKHDEESEHMTSLEERTDAAIVILQSLPCGRFAVLEKISDVFFDDAKQYTVELEKQHLGGLPQFTSHGPTKREEQIKKIQLVLISSIKSNPKAWAPMIFQWSTQTLSQICGQYATKRHFSSFSLEERFQMWLNCSATSVLLEITICCLTKIIKKNQDNCMKYLMNATLSVSPYYDWALAHFSMLFADIIPYKLLQHALEAFSNQSRKAEVIIETMLIIFKLVSQQKEEMVKDTLFQLYKESLEKLKKDDSLEKEHTILCTIPFLLHIGTQAKELFLPIIDRFIESMTHESLMVLEQQSLKRDEVLQRGLLRRLVECIKTINVSTFKLLQCLIKYACNEDQILNEENPELAKSAEEICSVILELLLLQLQNDVHTYSHQLHNRVKKKSGKESAKIAFLSSLATYTRQLCCQMLNSNEKKKSILLEILTLMALQEGMERKIDVLCVILANSNFKSSNLCLKSCVKEMSLDHPNVVEKSLEKIFHKIDAIDADYSTEQIKNLFLYLTEIIKEENSNRIDRMTISDYVKLYISEISQVLASTKRSDIAIASINLLQLLCVLNLRISEYAVITQAALSYYFQSLKKLKCMNDIGGFEDVSSNLKRCDELLVNVVNEYKGIQQLAIRMLVEGILKKASEAFETEPEEPIIKLGLMNKNYSMMKGNRFSNNLNSVSFKDGLRLNKRKAENFDDQSMKFVEHFFINTLSSLLSIPNTFVQSTNQNSDVTNNFLTTWGEKQYSRTFPSAYVYTATVLVELVCPEITPVMSWPDEDFLKYTIERDLKVKNTFESEPFLWDILEVISTARPSLYHCSVLLQSLLGLSLKYWQSNRNTKTEQSPRELRAVTRLMLILKQGGWLPTDFESISDIFHLIKPKELYEILSIIWKYFKFTSFSPEKFIDRDQLGRPQIHINTEQVANIKAVVKVIFLRNISKLGNIYHRFLRDTPT